MHELKYFIILKYRDPFSGSYMSSFIDTIGCFEDPITFMWEIYISFKREYPSDTDYYFIVEDISTE